MSAAVHVTFRDKRLLKWEYITVNLSKFLAWFSVAQNWEKPDVNASREIIIVDKMFETVHLQA